VNSIEGEMQMKRTIFPAMVLLSICLETLSSPKGAFATEGFQKWTFETGGRVVSSPALGSDGTIYVGSNDGHLYAIKPAGGLKWKFLTKGAVHSRPTVGPDGTVYVGSFDHNVYAIREDGSLKWSFSTQGRVTGSPALGSDGIIYVSSWDHHIYALGPEGSLKWKFPTRGEVFSSPAIAHDGTIYVGSWDHYLYALDGTLRRDLRSGGTLLEKGREAQEPHGVSSRPPEAETLALEAGRGNIGKGRHFDAKARTRMFKEVKEIRVEVTPEREEKVIFVLNCSYSPQVFVIEGNKPRWVCDFFGANLGKGVDHRIAVNGEIIHQIRIGLHAGSRSKVRVVLDLAPGQNHEIEKRLFEQEHLYVLAFRPVESDETR
jgi:hypothetical protein